jgi:hypothetical protein
MPLLLVLANCLAGVLDGIVRLRNSLENSGCSFSVSNNTQPIFCSNCCSVVALSESLCRTCSRLNLQQRERLLDRLLSVHANTTLPMERLRAVTA